VVLTFLAPHLLSLALPIINKLSPAAGVAGAVVPKVSERGDSDLDGSTDSIEVIDEFSPVLAFFTTSQR